MNAKHKHIKLSIIMPVYNVAKYLERAIDSVIKQDYDNWELICINDCSPDNSMKILQQYAQQDSRLKILETAQNSGVGQCRNIGLDKATGDWILFFDSDDYYSAGLFKRLVDVISKYDNLDIIEFRFNVVHDGCNPHVAEWLDLGKSGIRAFNNAEIMLSAALWNKCFKKDFLLKYNLKNITGSYSSEEIPMHICAFLKADNIYYDDFIGYNWRLNLNSTSHSKEKDRVFLNDIWRTLDFLKKELTRLELYNETDYGQFSMTILSWNINEKFSFSRYYHLFYNKCRRFFRQYGRNLKPYWRFAWRRLFHK